MPKGRIRHMFPGGNTSKGFYSFYKYIISQEDARRIFILKGGPGVGKSTFMKKAGTVMVEQGYDVEFMHCSSDNNSLDGLVIPRIGVAMIDGTAPHVVDPKNPGVIDEIIHLGDFWNEAAICRGRQDVIRINSSVGAIFERAYRYLKAAAHINEDNAVLYTSAVDKAKINKVARELADEVFDGIPLAAAVGRERSLFASAITPDGLKNYLDDLIVPDNVYMLEGLQGTGAEKVLERLKAEALERGFYVETYYCAFNPDKLEHLIIPDLNTAFTTVNKYHSTDVCAVRKINFIEMLDDSSIAVFKKELEFNQLEFDTLLDRAVYTIRKAKLLHDEMETYYIPYMDFDAVQRCWEATMARIMDYAAYNEKKI
jgi:hypothetical protein